ncbi:OmpP1/FadL family transporter [Azohydromonas lata]|uniref:Outer membrane protein transport protein n=1 Tax=Azohydromonas lata TaxID=45677 RepID=A0ABU5IHZ9_9BURK|nr:outer membrane protein transport protein [Azohydromonas lata]MDZ5458774.1 outer membrane protein transport protein [Azohydromonas lata]
MTKNPLNPRLHKPALKAVPAALLGLLGCSLAQAAGFQLLEQNASGIGTAYAGSAAVADNASTIYFNPAGMTELRDREISLGGSLVDISAKFRDNGSFTGTPPGVPTLAGNGGNAGTTNLVPNAYLSWKLSPQLWGGIGISAPFGLKTEYDDPWVGAAHARHFDVKTLNINPSLAFKVNDTLSVGAGINYQRISADYLRTISVAPLPTPIGVLPLQASSVSFRANDWSWGWNVGVLYKPNEDTRLGISYRSAIKHTLDGSLNTSAPAAAAPAVAAIGNSGAYTRIKLPETLIISGAQRVNAQWEVLGDVSWTGWNSVQDVNIVRTSSVAQPITPTGASGATAQTLEARFRNTWRVALGANYALNNAWTLKGGLAYDRTPVAAAETTLVSLPDGNRTWLSAGAQWRPDADSRVDFGLAHIFVKDTDINNNQLAAGRGLVRGSYDSRIWLMGVQYSRAF